MCDYGHRFTWSPHLEPSTQLAWDSTTPLLIFCVCKSTEPQPKPAAAVAALAAVAETKPEPETNHNLFKRL